MNKNVDSFYQKWENQHFHELNKQLNEKLRSGKYKKIMFFIHGYNVPYSLANVQLISLKNTIKKSLKISTDEILFVPIFWSSNANKNCNIKDESTFDITNRTKISDGGLDNGVSFMYYSNRAYYAAITLRKLINKLPDDVDLLVFSHSLGATLITSAMINTVTKLHSDEAIKLVSKDDGTYKVSGSFENCITKDIVEGFASEPLPKRKIKVFMSAPAIPGEDTFSDVDTSLYRGFSNKVIFATINLNDEMLTKNIANLPYVNRHSMSASSLGCDFNDAKRSKNKVENLTSSKFVYKEVSKEKDHDILTYLNQPAYVNFIGDFFNGKIPDICDSLPIIPKLKCHFANEYLKLEDAANPYLANGNLKNQNDLVGVFHLSGTRKCINQLGIPLMNIIFEMESFTFYSKDISDNTRELIAYMRDPYLIVLVERAIKEDETLTDLLFKEKILKAISGYLKLIMSKQVPYYMYETTKRQIIKFVSVRTGNDLFVLTTRNLDRDYTGSLLLEISTDRLNPMRKRPLKTYQTLLYGFDVFTPAFYDTTKFTTFSSYDSLDRPHASFQYFGWSKKGLSKYNKMRWSFTAKLGKIGGRAGEQFQTVLHQDVSNSLRPRGWDAQIVNGGRLGFSFETGHEFQFYQSLRRTNRFWNLNLAAIMDTKVGTYMTNGSFGFAFSNKNFAQNNHNFINHRTRQGVVGALDHLMYNVSLKGTYVVHNTMLEGYGIVNTTEWKSDAYTPKSMYFLQKDQVNRFLLTWNVTLSYTTRYFTIFYNWYAFSPETKLGKLNTTDERVKNINLSTRWHQIAEIGLTFNIH